LVSEFRERLERGERPSVDEYCQRHPRLAVELRNELYALIDQAHPMPDQTAHVSPRRPDLPERIGDYRIIGEIGRGGMGVVYEAEQTSLRRRVALKVLPQNQHAGENARIRFQREARAAAKMHHTNIVPVFEVGQDEDRFFYAMQLINGRGLDSLIKDWKHSEESTLSQKDAEPPAANSDSTLAPSDEAGMTRRERYRRVAKIAYQAADALAYAHHRGIIHRDRHLKGEELITNLGVEYYNE
jgi:serine/threonine protein kinase